MEAATTPRHDVDKPTSRLAMMPAIELLVVGAAVAMAAVSWYALAGVDKPQRLYSPPLIAALLVANLLPGIALLMLLGRRIARRRARRSPVGGQGQLHVRLVALFSLVAAVPMLLVTIAASLLFQYGVQFWYSDRARAVFENAAKLTHAAYDAYLQRWEEATVTMAGDIGSELRTTPIDSPRFAPFLFQQVYYRSLSEAAIFAVSPRSGIQTLAILNPYAINLPRQVSQATITKLRAGQRSVVIVTGDRVQTFATLPGAPSVFVYAARVSDPRTITLQTERAEAALANYHALLARARSLQLRFNAALLLISLLIVGIAVWIALAVADRLVRPVGELVDAARRVAGGDLSARVADPRSTDEVGTLARAFNQMTGRIEAQNSALVTANDQLENRRALIEAVMAGVSAGVVSADRAGTVRIANQSAMALLGDDSLIGRALATVAPELADLVASANREAIVQITRGEARTLAVRIAYTESGAILTFDDITQQVIDQRRAAWSDVARRIAHEIKNPLTPIQLAAERLQRRYGSKIDSGDAVFGQLTETIVRQVGDLRRMVDEFSSFARMPKPVFREENLAEIARQALFLHEVAHPDIRFELMAPDGATILVCDRRQIGQALTNLVKNAVEAIEVQDRDGGEIILAITGGSGEVSLTVADTGVGLPAERERIVEPYMTTRARGTGLGLAIVTKIIEEHHGTMVFSDRPGGGTVVTIGFNAASLATMTDDDADIAPHADRQLVNFMRHAGS